MHGNRGSLPGCNNVLSFHPDTATLPACRICFEPCKPTAGPTCSGIRNVPLLPLQILQGKGRFLYLKGDLNLYSLKEKTVRLIKIKILFKLLFKITIKLLDKYFHRSSMHFFLTMHLNNRHKNHHEKATHYNFEKTCPFLKLSLEKGFLILGDTSDLCRVYLA